MATEPHVRCPGSYEQGCGGILLVSATWCGECGRTFEPHELFDRWIEQVGWMEAELEEIER